MKLIVGLGNPGRKYAKTRHNVGFMVIDEIAKSLIVDVDKKKFKGLIGETNYKGEKVILLKPQTYMNNSGQSIIEIMNFYKVSHEDVLVIYDDLDLPVGKVKIKPSGGTGGHNGLKSIEAHLKTKDYKRIRIGIDNDKDMMTADYVLGKFSKIDKEEIDKAIELSKKASLDFIISDFNMVMNSYN